MSDSSATETATETTLPIETNLRLDGPFNSEDEAREFGQLFLTAMRIIGKSMDLSSVDGVTISASYHQALAELDRGRAGLRLLTASSEEDGVIGVAMAPAVLRGGKVKTHLIFDVHYVLGLREPSESEMFALAVHTIAHECAHAVAHSAFDHCFPNVILQEELTNYVDRYRQEVVEACWEEYVATRLSSTWGSDPLEGYLETFTKALTEANRTANGYVVAYRTHGDIDQILAEVPPVYANLIKWASYLIGTMHGLERSVSDIPSLAAALGDHWFGEYFERLEEAYITIWDRLGKWTDRGEFDRVGDIAIEVLERGGIYLTKAEGDGAKVDIPFRANNTPLWGLFGPTRWS